MLSSSHSLCCEALPEERSAGNPHATFCGNRWQATATDDPVLAGRFRRATRPVVESFFGSLKQELVQWKNYQTRYEAQQDILEYIAMFYNHKRLHSYLGYMSPNAFEQELLEVEKAA